MKRAISLAVISLLAAGTASAADLMSVYRDALANDPTIRQADALRKASRERKPQAWAALLPQITGQGSYNQGSTNGTRTQITPVTDPITGRPTGASQIDYSSPNSDPHDVFGGAEGSLRAHETILG